MATAIIDATKQIAHNCPPETPQYHAMCSSDNCRWCEDYVPEKKFSIVRDHRENNPSWEHCLAYVKENGCNFIPEAKRDEWRREWEYVDITNFKSKVRIMPGLMKDFVDDIVKRSAVKLLAFVEDSGEFAGDAD